MSAYEILWTFFLYSFLGWCGEVIFAACKTGHFVNRGFLAGPVCPIYGVGVVAVTLLISPIRAHLLQAYLVAVVVPTAIEYFVGWLAHKVLGMRLWDYSRMPLNIGGYVCLLFSMVWGLGCMVVVYWIQPGVLKLLSLLPRTLGWILLGGFSGVMAFDLAVTGVQAAKIPRRIQAVEELEAALRRLSDGIGSNLSQKTLALWDRETDRWAEMLDTVGSRRKEFAARRDALLEKFRRQTASSDRLYARLSKAFPQMKKSEANRRLEWGRDLLRRWREKQ